MNRNSRYTIFGFLGAIMALALLAACSPNGSTAPEVQPSTKENNMKTANASKAAAALPEIPPMDATAPAVFETAAFGLG